MESITHPTVGSAALRGGFFGAGLAFFITCLYFALPALFLLMAALQSSNADPQGSAAEILLKGALAIFLCPAAIGFVYAAVLMALTAMALERRPRLVRSATTGAAIGSVSTAMGELLLVTLSAVILRQIQEPAELLFHWILSLSTAAAGALVGLLLGLLIGAMLAAANPD